MALQSSDHFKQLLAVRAAYKLTSLSELSGGGINLHHFVLIKCIWIKI